ncbi:MAG: enoyl-CoA hydratase [Alphaproteobacteria bacterium]|nr:enoyl-CoA hydratase [Alphaproteobacteria bacterium]
MSKYVKTEIKGGVMEIVIARPEKKNALTSEMYQAFVDALARAERDADVHAVLFAAEGDMFTAGNDMEDFALAAGGTVTPKAVPFMEAIAAFPKPVVAAVHGHAVGIGTTMLLHCDLVYIAESARLSAPFMKLGIVPEAASSLLIPMLMGHRKAFAMFALGESMTGPEAVACGLANAALPADEVRAVAGRACAALANVPAGALRAGKGLMRDRDALLALIRKEAVVLTERVQSPEAREVFAAFLEKRAPDFTKLRAAG